MYRDLPMTDLPGTLTALGTLVAAIGAVVIAYRNSRQASAAAERAADAKAAATAAKLAAEQSKVEIVRTRDGVFEVGKQIDGRLTELLTLTREAALAEGRLEGAATQKLSE